MAKQGYRKGGDAAAVMRREQALELRADGLSYRDIGKALDVSHEQARRDVQTAMVTATEELKRRAQHLLAIEYERLEAPVEGLMPRVTEGDPQAIAVWIRLSESRRKLLGLDAPTRADIAVLAHGEEPTDDELLAIASATD